LENYTLYGRFQMLGIGCLKALEKFQKSERTKGGTGNSAPYTLTNVDNYPDPAEFLEARTMVRRYGSRIPAKPNTHKLDQIVVQARQAQDGRNEGYRQQSLKIHPWVCGRCGREFTRENLRELTVHHKDHNHDNNPPDGSNWENLCLYCHDNEHARHEEFLASGGAPDSGGRKPVATHNPFANLQDLLNNKQR
jgi:hypothetical protein